MTYCPSARPDMPGAVVFGVVGGTVAEPRVRYLDEPVPVSAEVLALAEPVEADEVFRIGAPCAEHACQHFDGARCSLAERLVASVPPVVDVAPPCRLRPQCRWWDEQGVAACRLCPLVVTRQHQPRNDVAVAAQPPTALHAGAAESTQQRRESGQQ